MNTKKPPQYLSFESIVYSCDYLVQAIKTDGIQFDAIIGLSRGGLIPAVIFSHKLDVVLVPASYSSKEGNGDDKNHPNMLPVKMNSTLLIVDDICDGGHTMKEVVEFYEDINKNNKVYSAVLHFKETSVHEPTYFAYPLAADAGWIIYPWER